MGIISIIDSTKINIPVESSIDYESKKAIDKSEETPENEPFYKSTTFKVILGFIGVVAAIIIKTIIDDK